MPKLLPPLCVAITVLRRVKGLTVDELAEKGFGKKALYGYERGHVSREKAEQVVAAMGFRPAAAALDRALEFIEDERRKGQAVYPQEEEKAIAEVDELQAFTQRLAAAFAEVARPMVSLIWVELRARIDRQQAVLTWEKLKRKGKEDRLTLIRKTQECRNWALAELLCAESIKAAPDSAQRALDLAELAEEVAARVRGDEAWRKRVQGYAGVHVGNAQRVLGQLRVSDGKFAKALPLWKDGAVGDPGLLNEARVLGIVASLRLEQGRYKEAVEALDKGLEVDRHGETKNLLIQRAYALELLGDYHASIAVLQRAAILWARDPERRLQWVLLQNLTGNLCHLRRFEEAAACLGKVNALALELGNGLDALRTRWYAAWVAAGLGRRREAIAGLEHVRDAFAAEGIGFDTALATLELAVLYLEEGRTREVRQLALGLAWVFQEEGVHQHALAALRLFCEAAQAETLTTDFARKLADYLYRARQNPQLRFEPPT